MSPQISSVNQTDSPQPSIAIVGAGAIGQLLFHQLASAGQAPLLIGRQQASTDNRPTLLQFTDLKGVSSTRTAQVIIPNSDEAQADLKHITLLIVCVKAYQVIETLKPLLPRLNRECQLLLLHNGMGPHLALAPYLNGRTLCLGTTSQGALKQQRWQVRQTGAGLTQLGLFSGPKLTQTTKTHLLNAIPNSQWCSDIIPMLWQKLAVNIAINPLTAIYQFRNGALAAPQYRHTILGLLDEVILVAQAEQVPLAREPLITRVFDVIHLTANNFSSMYQDIAHRRPTEIDAITGYLIQRAATHGIPTPHNQAIYQQLTTLEQRSN